MRLIFASNHDRAFRRHQMEHLLGASIQNDEQGRPWLLQSNNRAITEKISITHSGEQSALIIFPDRLCVGVDMEARDQGAYPNLTSFILRAEPALEKIPHLDPEARMFIAWTSKESIAKALGFKLSAIYNQLELLHCCEQESSLLKISFKNFPEFYALTSLGKKSVLTICFPLEYSPNQNTMRNSHIRAESEPLLVTEV